MAAPNPYFINLELYWPNGTRANQNQIARVKAFDVNGSVTTEEGQCGYNPNNGGWYPVYMQRISAFYPPRETPNLRFEVWSTAEQLVHNTQVFSQIPCGSTVRITIGVDAVLVGSTSSNWTVYGTVRHQDNTIVSTGYVKVFDITLGSEVELGTSPIGASGNYTVCFQTSAFNNNGNAHSQPNVRVRVYDWSNTLLGESNTVTATSNCQPMDVTIPNAQTPGQGKRRVFGAVRNQVELPVSGIIVEAYHVAWTTQGFQEFRLGQVSPDITSDGAGNYEILYDAPVPSIPVVKCGGPADQVNLVVYAKGTNPSNAVEVLFKSEILYNAPSEQRVDLKVNRTAVSTSSEYKMLDDGLSPCLGTTESGKWSTINQLNAHPEYLAFVVASTGKDENLIRAYVSAWLIAGEINQKVPGTDLSRAMSPEVIYGLLRMLGADSLAQLLNLQPDQFFDTIVRASLGGIVSSSVEQALYPDPAYGNKSLLDDWRLVLERLLSQSDSWQGPLLSLVFPDDPVVPQVLSAVGTSFASDATAHSLPMPSSVEKDDLLLVLFANYGLAAVTTPTGWTEIKTATSGTSTPIRFGVYAKIAEGNEGGTSVNFVTAVARPAAAQVYRIAKGSWAGALNESTGLTSATEVTGSGTVIDPPQTPSGWYSAKTLWLACAAHDKNYALSASPAGYTPSPAMRTNSGGATTSVTVLSARRDTDALSENPGSFTIATADDWATTTLGIGAGSLSHASKRQAVVSAHFSHPNSFTDLLTELAAQGFTPSELEDLTFVFEMYERVGHYFPIVAAVYGRKQGQGWKTIADLATVPVDGGTYNEDWENYVSRSLSFSQGKLPADVPGSSYDERKMVYAERLHAIFGNTGPVERFTDELKDAVGSHPELGVVDTFLDDHPDFDLERTNVDKYIEDNALGTSDADAAKIKQVQRVYRLTPDFDAALALISAGLDSSVKIARLDEGQFIADYEGVVGGITAAQGIYRTAAHYASEVLFTLVKFHQNLNDVGGLSALPGGIDYTILDPTEGLLASGAIGSAGEVPTKKFPNWITLFGDLNKCACKDCQTVLSPGAYLVDLLEFVDGAPKKTLFERRPDLVDIEISCPNTNVVLPYIDLVNETLEAVVWPLAFPLPALSPDAETVFDGACDGNSTYLDAIRLAWEGADFALGERFVVRRSAADNPTSSPSTSYREWSIEDDAWRYSIRQTASSPGLAFKVYPCAQTSPLNDSLEVFPEHYNVPAYNELAQAVFPFQLPLHLGREETDLLLRAKGLGRAEILRTFRSGDEASKLTSSVIALASLQLTSVEALAILGIGLPAHMFWGFTGTTVTIPRPDKPTIQISGAWESLMALVPVFLHRSGLSYTELLELLDTQFVHVEAGDPHGLHIAAPEDELAECNYNEFQVAHLNLATLRRISFFIRLWRKLGWTMRELDRYLMELEGASIPEPDSDGSTTGDDPSRFLRLSLIRRLATELKLAPLSVMAFYRPLDTRRTKRNPRSLFDDVFMKGSPTQPEIAAMESIARGGTVTLTTSVDLKAHVRGALGLKSEDIDALWSRFVDTSTTPVLDLERLSQVYRVATLCSALKLSVDEYYDLATLTNRQPLPNASVVFGLALRNAVLESLAAQSEFETARLAKVPAAKLHYYLTHESSVEDAFLPTDAQIGAAVLRLATAGQRIAAEYPSVTAPDQTALSALLGKAVPPEQLNAALALVASPQQAFIDRYLAELPNAASLYSELNLAPLASRSQILWNSVQGYLLDKAKTKAVLEAVTELLGVNEPTANVLLTTVLSRIGTGSGFAIEDWKAMLAGGWSTGEAVIEGASTGSRSATFVPNKGGPHRFVVVFSTGTVTNISLSLTKDGKVVTPGQSAVTSRAGHLEIEFDPIELQAGTAYAVTLNYVTGTAQISLALRVGNADPVPLPSSAVLPFNQEAYLKLAKAVGFIQALKLDPAEFSYLVEHPAMLSLDALPIATGATVVSWTALRNLLRILDLNRGISLKSGALVTFFRNRVNAPSTEPAFTLNDVVVETGWKLIDIESALLLWSGTPPGWDTWELWSVLKGVFGIVRRLDIRVEQILSLLVAGEPSVSSAATLRNVLRAQYTREAWKTIFKPLRDPLRQRQRDALVGYLTTRPVPVGPGGTNLDFFDANDLYAHFLIDVEMEPDTLISRIKLALNVVQLFVHRVFLGLEDSAALGELKDKKNQWTWMERYRVWEANRKVFLYPENWIEPELRDDKTEFFKELEDEMLQNPVTHENAVTAVAGYLEKMNEVSNLEIVGAYTQGVYGSDKNFVLHVIGRTRCRTRSFYYRTFEGKQTYDGKWNPWIRVNLEIDADVVSPVFANGKLYLVWPKVMTKERPKPYDQKNEGEVDGDNVAKEGRTEYQAEIRLMWSEYVAKKNKWTKPKVSKTFALDEKAPTPFQRELGENEARTENYHLRVRTETNHVVVDVIRTDVPLTGKEIEITTQTIQILWWKFTFQVPKEVDATLSPSVLGTFRIWYTGDDTFENRHEDTSLGDNYPLGTLLKSNAAVEVDYPIDSVLAKDTLQLKGNVPYFDRTPDTYRIFSSNFSFSVEAGKEPFFFETCSRSLFALDKPVPTGATFTQQAVLRNAFSTFNHPLVQRFDEQLHAGGMEALMDRLTEALPTVDDGSCGCGCGCGCGCACNTSNCYLGYHIAGDTRAWGITQRMFEGEFYPNSASVDAAAYPLPTVEFGYGTSFGIYNWELFFHVPMLIGARLSQELNFEDAMRWYHYVFDPRQSLNTYEQTKRWVEDLPEGSRYWTFLPFFANKDTKDSLFDTLGLTKVFSNYEREQLSALIAEWRNTPFNPHLIARHRLSAYQKFVVMKYLDNLIAWADQLFRQDTFETINEATQLYILADDLLGGRPEDVPPLTSTPKMTYRELRARGIDEFSNAIVEVESCLICNRPYIKESELPGPSPTTPALRNLALNAFFFTIPRNERLDSYWDTVKDRLFKIRNSMNIDGVKRTLALFEPPIDPALLVRATAAGLDLGSVLAQLNSPLPNYRFSIWMQKATELTNELKSFGAALLAALEKKDAESLQLLRQGHEIRMLGLVRKVRERQVSEAEANITALELSRAMAEERRDYYRTRVKVNDGEQLQLNLTLTTTVLEAAQGALHGLAGVFSFIPDSKAGVVGPFPTALCDIKIGSGGMNLATAGAHALGVAASITRGLGTMAGLKAGYERRWDDWQHQLHLAEKEIRQLDQQIAVANIRLDIAEKELANQETQIEQAEEMLEFLKDKFTSRDLYQWMVSQLTRTYQEVYKLAYNAAKTAERCFEFELGLSNTALIQFGYVDSLHQGLLAGEKLICDLKRLDLAYLERNTRELEIQKPISLGKFDGEALQNLRENGECEFELPEVLFDLDFPGHYFRRIKALRLTIPCVTGPHTSVSAKLTLLGSAFRKQSAVAGSAYAYTGMDDARFVQNPIGIQGIATGRAQGDAGVFELNFRDERYLPFEGAGTISRWKLELPTEVRQFDYHTISDVVLDLSYTARDGGGGAKQAANGEIKARLNDVRELIAGTDKALVRVFSLKREFPDALERLLAQPGTAIPFNLTPEHLPFVVRAAATALNIAGTSGGPPNPVEAHVILKQGATLPSTADLTLNGTSVAGGIGQSAGIGVKVLSKGSAGALFNAWQPETWTLNQTGLLADTVDDVVLIVRFTATV